MAGGPTIGRVSIRVVPDYRGFRRNVRNTMARMGRDSGQVFDAGFHGALDEAFQKAGKSGGKKLSTEINKAVKNVKVDKTTTTIAKQVVNQFTEGTNEGLKENNRKLRKVINETLSSAGGKVDVEVDPKISGNRNRFIRRISGDLERVLSQMELDAPLGDSKAFRAKLDSFERLMKKKMAEINDSISPEEFKNKADRIERLISQLQRNRASLAPRTPVYNDQVKAWLDAQKVWQRGMDEKHQEALDDLKEYYAARNRFMNDQHQNAIDDLKRYYAARAYWMNSQHDLAKRLYKEDMDAERHRTQIANRAAQQRADVQMQVYRRLQNFYKTLSPSQAQFDENMFRNGVGQRLNAVKKQLNLAVPVTLDDNIKLGELQVKLQALEKSMELELPVDLKLKKTAIAKLGAQIAALEGGARAIGALVPAATTNVDKLAKLVPNFGTGLNPAAYAVIIAGVLAVAAPAVGLLTTALLTLPGVLTSVLAPMGAIAVGFEGIKKAAENAGITKDGGLGDVFVKLREDVAGVFEEQLKDPFKQIVDAIPGFTDAFKGLAAGTSDVMKNVIDAIVGPEGAEQLKSTFSAIGTELSRSFGPGIADFTSALIGLANEFATGGALAGLGDWFRDTMADFKNWVSDISESEELTTWFEGLGSTLQVVADALGKIALEGLDFMSDPEKVEDFASALGALGEVLKDITGISSEIQPLVGAIAALGKIPSVAGTLTDLQNLGRDGGEGANFASLSLSPILLTWDQLIQKFPAVNSGLRTIGMTMETAVMPKIRAGVAEMIIGFATLPGHIQQVFGGIPGLVSTMMTNAATAISAGGNVIQAAVSTAFSGLSGIVRTAFAEMVIAVAEGVGSAVAEAAALPGKVVAALGDLGGYLVDSGFALIKGFADGMRNAIDTAVGVAKTVLGAVRRVFPFSPAKEGPFSGKGYTTYSGEALIDGLAEGIMSGKPGAVSAIREVMQAIKDVFGTAEGLNINFFMGQAQSTMSSMATSSKEFRTNMDDAASSLATTTATESGLAASDLSDVKRQKAELDLQIAQLQAQKNQAQDKATKSALTAEIDQLRIQKERLDLLKEENGLQDERKTAIQQLSDTIATNITDMIKMPGEFAKTTANAAMSDLGISGGGLMGAATDWALDAGTNFIFNVNNMDDAIQGQQAQQHKQIAGKTVR